LHQELGTYKFPQAAGSIIVAMCPSDWSSKKPLVIFEISIRNAGISVTRVMNKGKGETQEEPANLW
jgi:methyl coenzyme M reductase subunit C